MQATFIEPGPVAEKVLALPFSVAYRASRRKINEHKRACPSEFLKPTLRVAEARYEREH